MKNIVLSLLFICSGACFGAELSQVTRQEISHLFLYLENSGCQFNRYGTLYPPKDAVAHINQKYQYLLGKSLIPSAEAFIERAATESSFSSKPYLVQCNGGAPIESAIWFRAELANFRKSEH